MKKLIVIRGPLGVGKSTISKMLAAQLDAQYVSIDAILDENDLDSDDGIPVENYLKANQILVELLRDKSGTAIVDGCFYYREQIDDLKRQFGDDTIFVSLTSSVEKCIERDSKRAKIYGEDAARYVHMITTNIKEGFEIDNTELSTSETVQKIVENLSKK